MPSKTTTLRPDGVQTNTLGSLRLRHQETNEIILVPTPSKDPNDPLNWSRAFRYYLAIVVCLAVFFCNFLAAGPTVAIVETTIDFMGPMGPDFNAHISKVAFFYSSTALCQGVGMLFWMPLIIKYGRRPIYVISFVIYFATGLWAGFAKTYGVELAGRIIMGFAAGAGECLGPLTIADIFFLHERGAVMATYTAALSMGVAGGIIIDGLITITHSWQYIYWVASALIGAVTVLVIFTFPETTFDRQVEQQEDTVLSEEVEVKAGSQKSSASEHHESAALNETPTKESYISSLRLFNGSYTSESLFRIFLRPIVLIILPPVLWTSLVFSVTIGFLVAITSNFATAFSEVYHFTSWQSGLCFVSSMVGSLIGIVFGGHISDWTADWFTQRNGGIREPEMRLPSLAIGGICAPLSLILYGVGVNNHLHWMVPTLGLGLLNFAIVQATNVAMVYVIDCYRPAVGEVTVSILAFKAAFGFLLSFYTNPWIDLEGYTKAFGEMACISGVFMALVVIFYVWGKPIRHNTWKWRVMEKYGHWDADREVGE
ncbi:Major facilitator superfamily domain general substrate transporter [Penicillium riverlandense]|uniref:Major facilitator superfamily domain general substrate transporter n=1 Tax=Penicillium riverlandense TaxID=1903569 RepID=UPI002546FE89|nr:Major facilitator superfamily domain general substrate transporter [Penicillium riverlandense]KAJ5832620.1 Major facilitator superfamily domain general substrate transporter [Penicillium riverlandense]